MLFTEIYGWLRASNSEFTWRSSSLGSRETQMWTADMILGTFCLLPSHPSSLGTLAWVSFVWRATTCNSFFNYQFFGEKPNRENLLKISVMFHWFSTQQFHCDCLTPLWHLWYCEESTRFRHDLRTHLRIRINDFAYITNNYGNVYKTAVDIQDLDLIAGDDYDV